MESESPKKRNIFTPPPTFPAFAPASFAPGIDSSPTEISAPSSTKERGPHKKCQVTSNNIDGNYLGGSFGANITKGFSANQPAGVGTTQVAAAIPLQTSQASTQDIVEAEGGKKDPPIYCYTKGCENTGAIQPFKKDSRLARTIIWYCIPCNNRRLAKMNEEKSLKRKRQAITRAKSTLHGWAQIAHIAYHEEPLHLDFIKGRCIVGSFSRDMLYQWIISNRQILGPVNTVVKAQESSAVWTKIANTGAPSKGLYKVFSQNETHGWEKQVTKAMGGKWYDPRHNPNLFPISLFVQELKRKLGFTGQKNLTCRVKYGLVITVQDYVQAPHQDCQVTPDNPSWIFHVPLCKGGSYLYIWEDDCKVKKLVWIPLGSFLVLRDDVWHGGLCGGAGNVRVHGGIFDSMAIESTGILAYPPSTSLANYMKGHNSKHNKKGTGVNYDNAINLVGKNTSEQMSEMVENIIVSFATQNGFYERLPVGQKNSL